MVAEMTDAPGWSTAGYENITTSDGIAHGQVKQSGSFAFVRIYESGHEVPFYQPLVALEMFERAICGLDIAAGTESYQGYKSIGTPTSSYHEGNATIQFVEVPSNATYNTTTNEPNPFNTTAEKRSLERKKMAKRSDRLFKPGMKAEKAARRFIPLDSSL